MFGKIRRSSKSFLSLDLLFGAARFTAAAAVILLYVIVAVATGDYDRAPGLLLALAAVGAVFGFVVWVSRDARRTARELRQQRRKQRESAVQLPPSRDMSDGAEAPQTPPWMG